MSIQLIRVDERLIHGQVVIGWGSVLNPRRYVVVDDGVAGSEWEQELYTLGLPDGVASEFVTVDEARHRIGEWQSVSERVVLLARDLESVVRLAGGDALAGLSVNLGGIHHGPGRSQVLSYLYLDEADRNRLRELKALGVVVSARDLPGSKGVPVDVLLT